MPRRAELFRNDLTEGPIVSNGQRTEEGRLATSEVGTEFRWDAIEIDAPPGEDDRPYETGGQVAKALHLFIIDRILRQQSGKLRTLKSIGTRLIVFCYLLDQGSSESLAHEARKIGVSRNWLHKIGKEFGHAAGLKPIRTNGKSVKV